MKRCIAILLALLVLTACGTGGQAPAPEPESSPSSISGPAPEPSSSEASPVPESSSVPEESSSNESEPEESTPPPQSEQDPDLGPQENPDTSGMYSADEMALVERENELYIALFDVFSDGLSKESYSYYTCYREDGSVVLEIGVTDEAVVDAYLAAWTGAKWDKLVKTPGRVSQATQEEFAEKAGKLDLGPDVNFEVRAEDGLYHSEKWKILTSVHAPREQAELWKELPQKIKDLAKEMGIPEDMLDYMPPRYPASGTNPDGTVTNPDT